MKIMCQVYRSEQNPEMYLYVEKKQGLEPVPEALMKRFGEPVPLMVLLLQEGKKLARAEVGQVMSDITDQGFYLQMPPTAAQIYQREGAC